MIDLFFYFSISANLTLLLRNIKLLLEENLIFPNHTQAFTLRPMTVAQSLQGLCLPLATDM